MNRTRLRLWAGLFVLVVFSGGLAAGFAVRPWLDPEPPREFRGRGGPPPSSARRTGRTERLLDRLDADLELSDDQRGRLREVFEAGRLRFRELNASVREQFETERTRMNAEIATILTAEQMEIFQSRIVRMRRDRFGPRGPDGGRGPRGDRPESRGPRGDRPVRPPR